AIFSFTPLRAGLAGAASPAAAILHSSVFKEQQDQGEMCQIVFIPILIPSIHVCSQRQLHSSPCGFRKTPSRHTYHLHSKDSPEFPPAPFSASWKPLNFL
ncbi:hypothetical protein CHARACLAT_016644, partial [Characodon lateralis]|nr:hypothetical protein [Characodon lateralis]